MKAPSEDTTQTPMAMNDPQVDPELILDKIRKQIAQARISMSYEGQDLPAYSGATYPDRPEDITYDLDLYQHLDQVNQEWAQTLTTFELGDSVISRVPFIGRLWHLVKMKIHGPGLFYANRVAERQAAINRELVEVLNRLMASQQEQQREIEALKKELERLQKGH